MTNIIKANKLIEYNNHRIMDERYWDKAAADYDGEIFSCIANDRRDTIVSHISRFASKQLTAADLGCGVGKFLGVLADKFAHVHAIDLSNKLLKQASCACEHLTNITYRKADLSNAAVRMTSVDFALSVNVVIMPSRQKRTAIFDAMAKCLNKAGHLLLVVPSLESALYADFRLVQWNLKEGQRYNQAVSELQDGNEDSFLREGIVETGGVPTKHYLKEELTALFEERPFEILDIEKVEYCWDTEFDQPPGWMAEPFPWDWLVTLRKC